MMQDSAIERIKQALREGFADKTALRAPLFSICGTQDPEYVTIREYLAGRRWDTITIQGMKGHGIHDFNEVACWIDFDKLIYFLPGLLSAALENGWEARALGRSCLFSVATASQSEIALLIKNTTKRQRELIFEALRRINQDSGEDELLAVLDELK